MQKVQVADCKVYADRTSESRSSHKGDNLYQALAEFGVPCHQQEEAAD
ncbi:MAG: hypothetical protein JO033_07300 [Acidobacteriaceae bacterium]|nr:hypothetical protein [Acidobacteriaceae bacterium]MBV9502981.1 hypothetical protein [Acidobacteriaceae bacterium]